MVKKMKNKNTKKVSQKNGNDSVQNTRKDKKNISDSKKIKTSRSLTRSSLNKSDYHLNLPKLSENILSSGITITTNKGTLNSEESSSIKKSYSSKSAVPSSKKSNSSKSAESLSSKKNNISKILEHLSKKNTISKKSTSEQTSNKITNSTNSSDQISNKINNSTNLSDPLFIPNTGISKKEQNEKHDSSKTMSIVKKRSRVHFSTNEPDSSSPPDIKSPKKLKQEKKSPKKNLSSDIQSISNNNKKILKKSSSDNLQNQINASSSKRKQKDFENLSERNVDVNNIFVGDNSQFEVFLEDTRNQSPVKKKRGRKSLKEKAALQSEDILIVQTPVKKKRGRKSLKEKALLQSEDILTVQTPVKKKRGRKSLKEKQADNISETLTPSPVKKKRGRKSTKLKDPLATESDVELTIDEFPSGKIKKKRGRKSLLEKQAEQGLETDASDTPMKKKRGRKKKSEKMLHLDSESEIAPERFKKRRKNKKKHITEEHEISSQDESVGDFRRSHKKRGRKRFKEEDRNISSQNDSETETLPTKRKRNKHNFIDEWYIASGFLDDVINLLMSFENSPIWTFQEFSKHWTAKRFSLVYRGRQTFKEFLEFSEEIFQWTKKFLLRPHGTKRRIGALYTIYGLYYKHPNRQFIHVRLTKNEYDEVLELIKPFTLNSENPDPAYCFRKLEVDGAIKHCATPMELLKEFENPARNNVEFEYSKEKLVKGSAVTEVLSNHQVQADRMLMELYCNIKADCEATAKVPKKSISMVNESYITDTEDIIQQMRRDTVNELRLKTADFNDFTRLTGNAALPVDEKVMRTLRNKKFPDQLKMHRQMEILYSETVGQIMRNKNSRLFMPQVKKMTKRLTIPYYTPNPAEKDLIKIHAPEKVTRSRKRPIVIREGVYKKDKVMRNYSRVNYKPFGEKCLTNLDPRKNQNIHEDNISAIDIHREGSDALDRSHDAVVKSATASILDPLPEMVQMRIKYISDNKVYYKTLKARVSDKQWEQMKAENDRMERFKNKILPLLGLGKENVVIDEIEGIPVCDEFSDTECNPSDVVRRSAYWKEEHQPIKEEDDDYIPTSDDDEDVKEDFKAVDENFDPAEFESDEIDEDLEYENVDEGISDDEYMTPFRSRWYKEPISYRRRRHMSYFFERDRVGVLNNDLIEKKPEKTDSKMKMVRVSMGNVTRYIPQPIALNSEPETFHSFNDYTTINKPPPKVNMCKPFGMKKNTSALKLFTIMSLKTKSRKPKICSSTQTITPPSSVKEDRLVFLEDWEEPDQNTTPVLEESLIQEEI